MTDKKPRKPNVKRLPKTQSRVLEELKAGSTLRYEHHADGSQQFALMPDGKLVRLDLAERLIASGLIRGMGDALFPGERAQTWCAA